jgi:hypothetical protein
MLIRTTFLTLYHWKQIYCDYFDQDHVLIVIWLDYKIVTPIDLHIVLKYDCWHCFLVFNIWVSHALEMTINFYYPWPLYICIVGQIEGKNLLYRGTIPFCLHIVPWRLISAFLHVGRVKISCGLLPTRFSSNFVLNSITVKKCEISDAFLIQMTYIIWKLAKKLHIRHLNGYPGFSGSSLVMSCWMRVFKLVPRNFARFWLIFHILNSNNSKTAW